MTREELKARFYDLSNSSEIKNVEDVYNEFLDCLVLPIDSINDLSDLECYDYTLEYEYYNLWIYTDKSEYQMCFVLKKLIKIGEKIMEERVIKFKDEYGDIYVKTNAPSYEIEDAIAYREELIEQECEEDCGFNAIANYLTKKGFTFEEQEEDCEEYWW